MAKILILSFISLPMLVHGQTDAACSKQEARFDGYQYYFETVCEKINRDDANQHCRSRGGWLAEINRDSVDQITDLNETVYFYNGLVEINNKWQWQKQGNVATNVHWASGEPSGATGGSGFCATLDSVLQSYEWNCSKQQSFICQFNICAGSGNCRSSVEDCKRSTVPLADGVTYKSYCVCKPGYYGAECTEQYCNPKCSYGGICASSGTDYECICPPGYYGNDCKEDYCTAYNPSCAESRICKSNFGEVGYSCICPAGYNGTNCTERIYENPTIYNLTTKQCSEDGEIKIEWGTSPNARNLMHRIQAVKVATGQPVYASYSYPQEADVQYRTITGLLSSTEYWIKNFLLW